MGASVRHGSFAIVADLPAASGEVFAMFSTLELRERWFRIPGAPADDGHRLDFRVGGGESMSATVSIAGVPEHVEYRASFIDIRADERLTLVYELLVDGARRSTSLVTVDLTPRDDGTRLTYTEQYAIFLGGGGGGGDDDGDAAAAERERSARLTLGGLAAALQAARQSGELGGLHPPASPKPSPPAPARQAETSHELDAADPAHFRRALGRFASGVVVVTAIEDGRPVGMTCQSFSSLSLAPPMVLFSAGASSTTLPRLRAAGEICINVLADDQEWLASQFSRAGTDKWRGVEWSPGRHGAPRIAGATLWCEGTIAAVHEGGDHFIVVVNVESLRAPLVPPPPLIFHEGGFTALQANVRVDAG